MQLPSTHRFLVATLCFPGPEADRAIARFQDQAAHLFAKHDLRIERTLTCTSKGQLTGENRHPLPQRIQVISFPSIAAFQAYTADPEYIRLANARDATIERLIAVVGPALDVAALGPTSDSVPSQRLYGVAFVRFLEGGATGLAEFNRRASGLFSRHGMHVEHMFDVARVAAPIGEALPDFSPERVIVFYLDDPSALKAYATDPEYLELAPLRDRGLASYDFFLGRVAT